MNRNLILPFISLLVIGCSDPVKVSPDKLPDAYLNQPYIENIEIINSAIDDMTFHSTFSDANFKITPEIRESGRDDYNNLTINGLPTTLDSISIYISGNTYGTNFPGKQFEKEYTIHVKMTK